MRRLTGWLVFNILFMIVFILGCAKQENMSDEYVMQVNDVGLRPGVFVRRYKLTKDYGSNQEFNTKILKKFIEEVLEPDYLFIQHAYDLGLHQEAKTAQNIRDYRVNLLASNHPVLYENMTILKDDLHKFYEKKSVIYDLEIVQTNSYRAADSIYHAILAGKKINLPKNEAPDFSFPRSQKFTDLTYGEQLHPDIFPALIKMKQGEVSKPFYTIPFWTVIKLNKKRDNKNLKPFNEIEKELVSQAQVIHKFEQQKQLVNSLRDKYQTFINKTYYPPMIAAFSIKRGQSWIDPGRLNESDLNKTLIQIHQDSISLSSFIASYNQSMQFSMVTRLTEPDLSHFIEDYISQYLLYLDALEKKVDQDPLIQDQLVNKENKTLLNRYLNEEIAQKVQITDAEAREHYQKNSAKWQAKYEELAGTVRGDLKNIRMLEKKHELVDQLRDTYTVRYNEALLAKIAEELTQEKGSKSN